MNRDMYLHKLHKAIPVSLFIALEGLSAAPVMAGDGVVVLQREVPVRPAIREGNSGRAVAISPSAGDKVETSVKQSSSIKPTELSDADFASVSTGVTKSLGGTSDTSRLSDAGMSGFGLNGPGSAGTVHSVTPMIAGAVGGAVGAATGQLNAGLSGANNPMAGLASAIMRTSGQ